MDWGAIEQDISRATGEPFKVERARDVGGGCINEAATLEGGGRRLFVKRNRSHLADMFAAEAAGLQEILASESIRVPRPLCHDSDGELSWLVLEYVEFTSPDAGTSARLGERLAAMHRHTREEYGWTRDNTIGSTPQKNEREADWVTFLRDHRLRYQLDLAETHGAPARLLEHGARLLEALPGFFAGYRPPRLHEPLPHF